jgi:hypothetical protein
MKIFNSSFPLFALALIGVSAFGQADQAFTATLSATGTTTPVRVNAKDHTLQFNVGSPATCSIQLEGSLDDVNWSNLSGAQSCMTSTMFHVDGKAASWVRANLTIYSGGGSVAILYRGAN